MVFGVVVHVPIEELHQGVEGKGPAAEPEVRHIVLQTDMLGVIAEKKEPATVEGG